MIPPLISGNGRSTVIAALRRECELRYAYAVTKRSSHRGGSANETRSPLELVDTALGIEGLTDRPGGVPERRRPQPVTIERTSKQYKFGMVVGRFFLYAGLGMLAFSFYVFHLNFRRYPASATEFLADQPSAYVSIAGIIGGYLLYRWEVFLAWWNNG